MKKRNDDSIEKIKEDLFEYRVDIKSYKRSINIIAISTSIIIAILGFFGYDKINHYEDYIIQQANDRLAITDSLLLKIDTKQIDSLKIELENKRSHYENMVAYIESMISENEKLEYALYETLPSNESVESALKSYTPVQNTNHFELKDIDAVLSFEEMNYLFVKMNNPSKNTTSHFQVNVYPKGRRIVLFSRLYRIASQFNKLPYVISKFENYNEFTIELSLIENIGQETPKAFQSKVDVVCR